MKNVVLDTFTNLNAQLSFLVAQRDMAIAKGELTKHIELNKRIDTSREAIDLIVSEALEDVKGAEQ